MENQKSVHIYIDFLAHIHWNLKIVISSPHNYQGIIWGRDKNLNLMLHELRDRDIKKYARDVFAVQPFGTFIFIAFRLG
jgi:hypothetical protein